MYDSFLFFFFGCCIFILSVSSHSTHHSIVYHQLSIAFILRSHFQFLTANMQLQIKWDCIGRASKYPNSVQWRCRIKFFKRVQYTRATTNTSNKIACAQHALVSLILNARRHRAIELELCYACDYAHPSINLNCSSIKVRLRCGEKKTPSHWFRPNSSAVMQISLFVTKIHLSHASGQTRATHPFFRLLFLG